MKQSIPFCKLASEGLHLCRESGKYRGGQLKSRVSANRGPCLPFVCTNESASIKNGLASWPHGSVAVDWIRKMNVIRGCVSKSFRTGRLERELQMVELSASKCSCVAILWVSLVSFATITLCVASQRVFIVVVISLSTQTGNFWIHPRICITHALFCYPPWVHDTVNLKSPSYVILSLSRAPIILPATWFRVLLQKF
jgi:hypothetical protein